MAEKLKRELGVFSLAFIGVISVIGSGVLVIPAQAASMAGPASLIAVIIAGVAMLLFLLMYAELSSEIPVAGGTVVYPDIANGKIVSSMIGFGLLLAYIISPPFVLEVMFSYLSTYFPSLYSNGQLTLLGIFIASLIFLIFYVINVLGVNLTGILSGIFGAIKVAILTVFILGLLVLAFHPANFFSYGGFAPFGFGGVGLAVSAGGLFFAFTGFRLIVDYAGEARAPKRIIPKSIILAVLLVFVVYLLMQIAFVGSLNWAGLSQYGVSPGSWSSLSNLSSPLSQIASANNLTFLSSLIMFFAIYSPLVFVIPVLGAEARLMMGLVDNGYLPKFFNRLSKRYKTPYVALTTVFILTILTLVLMPRYSSILSLVSSAYGFTYLTIGVHYSVIRKHLSPDRFKAPLGSIIAPISTILGAFIVIWSGYPYSLYGFLVMLVFLLVYLYYNFSKDKLKEDLRTGWWFIVFTALLVVISYLTSPTFGGIGKISLNETYVLVTVISIAFYFLGVRFSKKISAIDVKAISPESGEL